MICSMELNLGYTMVYRDSGRYYALRFLVETMVETIV